MRAIPTLTLILFGCCPYIPRPDQTPQTTQQPAPKPTATPLEIIQPIQPCEETACEIENKHLRLENETLRERLQQTSECEYGESFDYL